MNEIPVSQKYILTVEEASAYFHIGVNRLRRLISQHRDADWVLWNNTHATIKRLKFERYIDAQNAI